MGSYYDTMFGNGGSYDSNYAFGTDLISDAEVLTALGYPQAPSQPTRPSVLCYCGCRLNPSESHKHHHKNCMPRSGIFSMRGATPLGLVSSPRPRSDAMMAEPEEDNYCGIISSTSDNNVMAMNSNGFSMNTSAPNNTSNNNIMMTPVAPNDTRNNNMMTPMMGNDIWDAPIQSAPIQSVPNHIQSGPVQSAPPGYGNGMPFHVPDTAPMARPRLYRPMMQHIT